MSKLRVGLLRSLYTSHLIIKSPERKITEFILFSWIQQLWASWVARNPWGEKLSQGGSNHGLITPLLVLRHQLTSEKESLAFFFSLYSSISSHWPVFLGLSLYLSGLVPIFFLI